MWVCVGWAKEIITVVNIYAPNLGREREEVWKRLGEIYFHGKCILVGDFNMIE
eukprot:c31300_g1_i1 orf=213-371(+)